MGLTEMINLIVIIKIFEIEKLIVFQSYLEVSPLD